MKAIITRFAPSPTGNLHLGGIRTALINYIIVQQAKKQNSKSKFLLRIEDTDKERSNDQFKENIIEGLNWLDINYDGEIIIQSERLERHQEIAHELIKNKGAFKCICSQSTLEKKREYNRKNKINLKRLCEICEENLEIQSLTKGYTVRIKIANTQETSINDIIQGRVIVKNEEIDNFIILREDGSATYMLSAVVDDFDMGINLVIRGDDHLNNTFRQFFIYNNMNWQIPEYAHIPLIHGEDGKKLSKRHGAVDIIELKHQGYLKESIINNLILLGWSTPNLSEIILIDEIISLFNIKKISKSSSIFSYEKLNFINNSYIKDDTNFDKLFNYCIFNQTLQNYIQKDRDKFKKIFMIYKKNIKKYKDLEIICPIYFEENYISNKINSIENNFVELLIDFISTIQKLKVWDVESIEKEIKNFIDIKKVKFFVFGKPLRLILINSEKGPSISEILFILGKKNSIKRINNYISKI